MKDLINIMKKLNENKNGQVVTFDFDNTIVKSFPNHDDGRSIEYQYGGVNTPIIERIKKFKQEGKTVFVVTSRQVALENNETSIRTMLDQLNIKVDGIFYTNADKKAQKLYELGSSLHYDDDPAEAEAIQAFTQLHQDFNIKVIDADSLLHDINVVAKGLLMTSDYKFIIVQRSDSMEWDAAGGRLLQGEEPEFALWREIKEELQLTINNVQVLDTITTTWKNKKTPVHYFLATVPYSSDELDGAIALQWELADYFCGDLQEIDDRMATPDGSTENLRNAVNLILQNQDHLMRENASRLMERNYQQDSQRLKNYSADASELLSTGPQTKGWGTGIKTVKVKRGKSAPPGAPGGGWGPIEEDGEEPKKKIKLKIKIKSDLDEKKKRKKRRKGKKPGPKKGSRRKSRAHGIGWPYGGVGGYSTVDFGDGGGGDGGGGE